MLTQPLLSAPPAFVLLGVMVGLAAYLRQLGENRNKQIDEIEEGKVWNYPCIELHSTEKLKHLRQSRDRLNQIAPVAIWYTIGIAGRLFALAYARYKFPNDEQHYDDIFRFADLVIVAVLVVLLFALYFMHSTAKSKEERVRAMMDVWKHARKREPQRASSSDSSRPEDSHAEAQTKNP